MTQTYSKEIACAMGRVSSTAFTHTREINQQTHQPTELHVHITFLLAQEKKDKVISPLLSTC